MNNIKHKDLDIPKDNPFKNCKLGRSKNAEVLTAIIDTYADGFVLAVNNKWGTGKTTFIKMWQQQLENSDYKTLYFNAWENDFESSPLIALMGEFKTLIPGAKGKATFKALTKNAGVLAKNILPTIAGAIASKYINVGDITELIKNATEAGVEIFKDEIDKYSTKKNGLIEFRNTLKEFIIELKTDKPIVFIIDELDRCRPNYAVEVLENIKHFFNVPNIVFVLSIDKEQLSHAIRGVYGSEHIDADEYLRRFIDLEYQIPEPNTNTFCEYLYEYYDFNSFLKSENRKNHSEFHNDSTRFISSVSKLITDGKLTLRQQEQIFGFTRLVLKTFNINYYVLPDVLIFLIYFRFYFPNLYSQIASKILTLDELNSELNNVLPRQVEADTYFINLIFIQAKIIYYYNNSFPIHERYKIINLDSETANELFSLRSKYDLSEDSSKFKNAFKSIISSSFNSEIGIDYLISKINLLDNIVT